MRSTAFGTVLLLLITSTGFGEESKADRLQRKAVALAESRLPELEKMVEKTKKAKVDKANAEFPNNSAPDVFYYPTAAVKTKAIKAAQKQLDDAKKKVADLKAGAVPTWPIFNGQDFRVGALGTIKNEGYGAEIIQVIDKEHALMRLSYSKEHLWATIPTEGLVDGSKIKLDGVWEITGTKTFPAALGANRTVFKVERVD